VTGDVVVTGDTGAVITLVNGFTYLPASGITAASPSSGQHGTLATATGVNLLGGGASISSATLAGSAAEVRQ
jgi:hypothetical protein